MVDSEISDMDGTNEWENVMHSGFGNHQLSCYVDVSTVPTTLISKPYDRNLQQLISIEEGVDDDYILQYKDFRDVTYVFEYNSPYINYLDLTLVNDAIFTGYSFNQWDCFHDRSSGPA